MFGFQSSSIAKTLYGEDIPQPLADRFVLLPDGSVSGLGGRLREEIGIVDEVLVVQSLHNDEGCAEIHSPLF